MFSLASTRKRRKPKSEPPPQVGGEMFPSLVESTKYVFSDIVAANFPGCLPSI